MSDIKSFPYFTPPPPSEVTRQQDALGMLVEMLMDMKKHNESAQVLANLTRLALKHLSPDDVLTAAKIASGSPAYEVVFPIVEEYRAQQEAKLRSASYIAADTDLKNLVR